jgi:urease accessory protein
MGRELAHRDRQCSQPPATPTLAAVDHFALTAAAADRTMGWEGHLDLRYRREGARTLGLDRHRGPLRVLRRLYPEGDAVCHQVLVHPPGGIVGGDRLAVDLSLGAGSHALLTTAGATRFYRSAGPTATQTVVARVDAGARLEWLPLETIAYPGCRVDNRLRFELAEDAQMIGWDVLALGLPAAGAPFDRGSFDQTIELPGLWLEHGAIAGDDALLLDSPLGLAGRRALATLWLASGRPLPAALTAALLDDARTAIAASALAPSAGVSAQDPRLLVLRALAPRVEPALQLLQAAWGAWRARAWQLAPCPPRVWRT